MDENSKPVSENNRNKDQKMIQLADELRRFAYQNGMAADQTNSFFKRVQNHADQQEGSVNRELRLYRAAAAELARDPAVQNDGSAIGFPEDRESHFALQSLPLNERMAAVLYLVNGHASSFAAQVLQLDERKLMELIDNAKQKIAERLSVEDPQELTQRMQFLEKSIKRIKLPENEALIDESPVADELPQEPIPKVKKPAIWLVAASIALLAGVVGSSFSSTAFACLLHRKHQKDS